MLSYIGIMDNYQLIFDTKNIFTWILGNINELIIFVSGDSNVHQK